MRSYAFMFMLLAVIAVPALAANLNHVVFSEVVYETSGNESTDEWVEIYNPTASSINISGFIIRNNNSNYTIPANTIINSTSVLFFSNLNLNLINNGDVLNISNGSTVIDQIYWENFNNHSWNIEAQSGQSIERVPANIDTNTSADWIVNSQPNQGTVRFGLCDPVLSLNVNSYYRPNNTAVVSGDEKDNMCNPNNASDVNIIITNTDTNQTLINNNTLTDSLGLYNYTVFFDINATIGNYSVFVNSSGIINSSIFRICIDCDNDTYNSTLILGGTDCNDDSSTIYPGAPETCSNSIDEDCNGSDLICTTTTSATTTAPAADGGGGGGSNSPPVPKPKTTTTESTTTEPTTTIETTTTAETATTVEENVTAAASPPVTGFAIGELGKLAPIAVGIILIIVIAAAAIMYKKNGHKKVYKYVAGGIKKK